MAESSWDRLSMPDVPQEYHATPHRANRDPSPMISVGSDNAGEESRGDEYAGADERIIDTQRVLV
jgi:hypothetical protein